MIYKKVEGQKIERMLFNKEKGRELLDPKN